MSTQYDNIGTSYDEMRKLPVALLETANVKVSTKPFISGAQVLDLACGTGHFSKAFLDWGASSAVGVDISTTMIEAARFSCFSENVRFEVGDCSKPQQYNGGPFDLVFGAWLLNYAPSGKDMANMFRNAAINLKDGGHFIAVTAPPTNDPKAHTEAALAARPEQYGGITVTVRGDVEDGVATHVDAITKSAKVEFDTFDLRKDVHESAAREGGFKGNLTWRRVTIPEGYGDGLGDEGDEAWRSYFAVPHFGILVACKGPDGCQP